MNLNQTYPFVNPPLPYAADGLEPYIDTKTMMLHHDAHLQTYVDNLNKALADYPQLQKLTLTELVTFACEMPWEIRDAVRNNAGGVWNHIMYFEQMAPADKAEKPSGKLLSMINSRFGSFEDFKKEFEKAGLSVFGSGSGWLVTDRNEQLQIVTTPNQDNPLQSGLRPLMILDVWEHAYYLKHYNKRADYIEDWWHVVDFSKVEKNLLSESENGTFSLSSLL